MTRTNPVALAARKKITGYMEKFSVDLIFVHDEERHRDQSLLYLTGHPNDSKAFLFKEGKPALFPWDTILAATTGKACEVIDTAATHFGSDYDAFRASAGARGLDPDGPMTIEVDAHCSISRVRYLEKVFPAARIRMDEKTGFWKIVEGMRAVKSAMEISKLRRVAGITSEVIDRIPEFIKGFVNLREIDLALFVEGEGRRLGADAMSFATLTANVNRSWGIHCYPHSTDARLDLKGLALIDFGFRKDGYCSDVTVPMAFGPLSKTQELMAATVLKAYEECLAMIRPGVSGAAVNDRAQEIIQASGLPEMPHGLGHGIGLDIHDPKGLRSAPKDPAARQTWTDYVLEAGFYTSLEPGIYHPEFGGCRFENDILVTETGHEVLTRARFLRFPDRYYEE